jgi:hypothetical protein
MQSCAGADGIEQLDRALLEHAGANSRQNIGAILALEDDGIDAVHMQQLREQQAGRSGADDGDLSTQNVLRSGSQGRSPRQPRRMLNPGPRGPGADLKTILLIR